MDVVVTLALIGLTLGMAVANLVTVRRRGDMERLVRQLATDLMRCRILAITGGRNVGLVFVPAGEEGWYYCMVEDGDYDGVSRHDFLSGVDPTISPRMWLRFLCSDAGVGVPQGWDVPDPSGGGMLTPGDGLRIGRQDIVSFSAAGHATASTLFFHDAIDRMVALRIHGSLGRVRALEWRRGWRSWREMPM